MAEKPALIIADSTVWVDWLRGNDSAAAQRLDQALAEEDVAMTPLIVTEVLQGFRVDAEFEDAERLLTALPMLRLDVAGHVAAARLFRSLRRRGITVRGTIDCIIAQTCLGTDTELLTTDRDFLVIARHSALRLCEV